MKSSPLLPNPHPMVATHGRVVYHDRIHPTQRPETPGQTNVKSAAAMALRRLFFSWPAAGFGSCGAYTQACGAP
eukprot:6644031-Prymnesium_polylepis.1